MFSLLSEPRHAATMGTVQAFPPPRPELLHRPHAAPFFRGAGDGAATVRLLGGGFASLSLRWSSRGYTYPLPGRSGRHDSLGARRPGQSFVSVTSGFSKVSLSL